MLPTPRVQLTCNLVCADREILGCMHCSCCWVCHSRRVTKLVLLMVSLFVCDTIPCDWRFLLIVRTYWRRFWSSGQCLCVRMLH